MAKYLDTSHISSELMELLKEAKEKIILVTYSLQVNSQIQERLKTKSKLGTLSEITIIYGNTKLNNSELKWMSEIDDLKEWQKKNLHAKCYINENKAIIASMNLYDYSQTSNVEMGFLITKEKDPEAYNKMMEDIADLRINGERLKPWEEIEKKSIENSIKKEEPPEIKLSYSQQIKKQLLEFCRNDLSVHLRQRSEAILSDSEILDIASLKFITKEKLKVILKSEKKYQKLIGSIEDALEDADYFVLGKVTDSRYQNNDFAYDQVQLSRFDDDSCRWYDTTQEVPKKDQIVAVRLNRNWFNDYLILEETNTEEDSTNISVRDFSNSKYRTTKELSEITGISSREINSILVSANLMEKRGADWYATKNGALIGALQKEGQYGKFIIWPEEIIKELDLV